MDQRISQLGRSFSAKLPDAEPEVADTKSGWVFGWKPFIATLER